ncbi:restriction endonuclease subunit S [Pseudoalteromonas sp. CnMc7-37]|uniref:restriction endonuclease subunit S n=1 Tax=Pseudoalteromonas sp. CnMc7-37 TaxID=2954496 RepID=UPI0020968229|nr:restriction endonuclease subunit S [Pseudoalteromonas sp. CnMc7-37]
MSWPLASLGEVAPSRPLKNPEIVDENSVWLLNLDKVESHSGVVTEKVYASVQSAGSSTHWFDERHVLYSKLRPYLNKVVLPEEQGLATTELVPLFPDKDRLDRKYLTYYLRSNSFVNWISDQVAGAKMPRVSMKVFWEHQIPLPPLEEQKRIAAILDKADSVRCKRQQAIDLADDFLRSVFLDMFGDPVTNPKGWETKPLKLLCDIKGGGTPSKSNETYWGGDIPWVSPKDMKSLYISTSKDKITSEAIKGSSTKLIDTDSVLMVVRSGVLKHTVPLALTTKPVSINQDMKAFSCRADLNSHYLLFCLKAFSQFLLGTVRGTTADNLSSDVINNLSVPVPPIEMQEKFASIALKQQSTKAKNKNSNDLSLLSFNSLSQKAFVGEL